MAVVSLLLAVLAFGCTLIGFLTTPIPVIGTLFSFGAAAVALGGILLGGRAISRAKQAGLPNDIGRIAVVLNVLAFIPALLVAFTCGVCNAIFSTGNMHFQRNLPFGVPRFDAGAPLWRPSEPEPPPGPPGPEAPPGKLPPPPLPPGPGK